MENLKLRNICKSILFLFLISYITSISLLSIYCEIQRYPSEIQKHFNIGNENKKAGKFSESIENFGDALRISRQTSEAAAECDALLNLGLLNWNIGKMEESSDYYSAAYKLALKHQFPDYIQIAEKSLEIHRLYSEAKELRNKDFDYQKSKDTYLEAVKISRELNSLEHEVKLLRQLSLVYWDQNSLKEAADQLNNALKIARDINHKLEIMRCLNNLGIYYDNIENYSQALIAYEEASKIAQDVNRQSTASDIKNNISIIYKNLGEFDKAIDYLEDVLIMDQDIGDNERIAKALNNLGETYRRRALATENSMDFNKALEYFNEALYLTKKIKDKGTEVRILNNIGTVYADRSAHAESLSHFELGLKLAEEIEDEESIGMINNNIGIIHYNQGNYTDSTEYFQKAIDQALRIDDQKTLWEAYLELARVYEKQNRFEEALTSFKESIFIIEDIRSKIYLEELKASFLGTDKRIEAYQDLINLLVTLNSSTSNNEYAEQAFLYLEKAKARAFLDQLETSQINISKHVDFVLQNQEKEIEKDITELLTRLYASGKSTNNNDKQRELLKTKEGELENIKREIRSKSPAYANIYDPKIINLKKVQENLIDSKTAFFEYSIGKRNSLAFVITEKNFLIFRLPPKDKLLELVSKYLEILSDKESSDFSLGNELFKILIAPGITEEIESIIFIADDILNYLPFETLVMENEYNKWLVQDYKIAYAPSITALTEIVERKSLNGHKHTYDLLALGDPFYGQYEDKPDGNNNPNGNGFESKLLLKRLVYSQQEIERISAQFKPQRIKIYVRKEASKTQIIDSALNNFKIIHVAAHSEIDDKNPSHSYIALSMSEEQENDALLYTSEIYNLTLNSDLVTLSACQSGLGKLVRGEGMEGLNRAFFYAGTSAVLMSLWPVNDQATSQLMERFYFHINNNNSIMKSLRDAKLELIKSDVLSHPYYWAGFIVSGKADQVVFPKKISLVLKFGLILFILSILIFIILRKKKTIKTA